jgi:hypothetical protein
LRQESPYGFGVHTEAIAADLHQNVMREAGQARDYGQAEQIFATGDADFDAAAIFGFCD